MNAQFRSYGVGCGKAVLGQLLLSVACVFTSCGAESPSIGKVTQALGGSGGMVISQIYGEGGSPGASYHNDFVELFNRGTVAVDISGWSLQYGSSAVAFSLQVDIPAPTVVQPNHYFLIQLGSSGSHGASVPSPDLIGVSAGAINVNGADGKVALVNSTVTLGCGTLANPCSSASIVDLVGYGDVTDYEGLAAISPAGVTASIVRKDGGCVDSDDNADDFEGAVTTPRNAASPIHLCGSATNDAGVTDAGATEAATADSGSVDAIGPDSANSDAVIDQATPLGGSDGMVISQVYGSGGDSGARYRNDFVELFNRGTVAVDMGGWSLQYAPKDSVFSVQADIPAVTIVQPNHYFLIRLSSGGGTGMTVPTPELFVTSTDAGLINISATAGKLALVNTSVTLACGSAGNRCSSATIVDLVGYGDASDFETAPSGTFGSAAESLFRKDGGCVDHDDNASDFESATGDPRNGSSPIHLCGSTTIDDAGVTDGAYTDATASDVATLDDATVDEAVMDAGANPSFDAAVMSTDSAVATDASSAPRDSGSSNVDSNATAGGQDADTGGCGCHTASPSRSTHSLAMLVIGAAIALQRRRRCSRPS